MQRGGWQLVLWGGVIGRACRGLGGRAGKACGWGRLVVLVEQGGGDGGIGEGYDSLFPITTFCPGSSSLLELLLTLDGIVGSSVASLHRGDHLDQADSWPSWPTFPTKLGDIPGQASRPSQPSWVILLAKLATDLSMRSAKQPRHRPPGDWPAWLFPTFSSLQSSPGWLSSAS